MHLPQAMFRLKYFFFFSRKSPSLPDVQKQVQCWELWGNLSISCKINFIWQSNCLVFLQKADVFQKAAGSLLQALWKPGRCSLALGLLQASKSCRKAEHNIFWDGLSGFDNMQNVITYLPVCFIPCPILS